MKRRLSAAAILATGPAVALLLLAATGGLSSAGLPGLPAPGTVTRIGLPLTQALRDVASIVTVGAMVLALTCVPPSEPNGRDKLSGARRRLVDLGGRCALGWSGLSLALIAFTYSDASGQSLSSPGFTDQALFFAREYELGRYLLVSAALAGLAGLVALSSGGPRVAGLGALLAVAALWPLALTAHGAGTLRHDLAVDAQFPHLLAVAVWGGGLVGLVSVRRALGTGTATTMARFSVVATWCFVIVTLAGLAGALIRIGDLSALRTTYGAMLGLKVVAVVALCALGLAQRRRLVRETPAEASTVPGRLLVSEALVMLAAAGIAVALNRTPPPSGDRAPLTNAEDMLGYPMPAPLGAADWFTAWEIDGFWLPVAAVAIAMYVTGVLRLRSRGDHWSLGRTVAWVGGWLLFVWATSGAPGAYGRVLFSMHMVQHMTIAATVPVLLVLGAPVTLAVRALRRRVDGSMGPREWVLAAVHSPVLAILGNPIVAGILFIVGLVVFYYSSLLDLSLESHTGHVLMTGHFLLTGYLFVSCLVGVDPGQRRPTYPMRVLMVMTVFGFHAFFSVSLMASTQVLAEDWFERLGRPWGASLADDQYLGASLGWALGDYPLAMLAGALVVLWVRADRRERSRFDRQEKRSGDRELNAYNAHLGRIAANDVNRANSARVNYDRTSETPDSEGGAT